MKTYLIGTNDLHSAYLWAINDSKSLRKKQVIRATQFGKREKLVGSFDHL